MEGWLPVTSRPHVGWGLTWASHCSRPAHPSAPCTQVTVLPWSISPSVSLCSLSIQVLFCLSDFLNLCHFPSGCSSHAWPQPHPTTPVPSCCPLSLSPLSPTLLTWLSVLSVSLALSLSFPLQHFSVSAYPSVRLWFFLSPSFLCLFAHVSHSISFSLFLSPIPSEAVTHQPPTPPPLPAPSSLPLTLAYPDLSPRLLPCLTLCIMKLPLDQI